MKIAIVTSFNEKLYNYYAHRFLATYDWPFDLYVYHEGWTPEDFPIRNNVIYKNLYSGKTGNELKKFIARMRGINIDSVLPGQPDKIIHGTNYKKDAIRFCYKVFAKTDLILSSTNDYNYVFWVDADMIFKKTISAREVVEKFLPGNFHISHIHRPTYYSECGFVGYNLRKLETKIFALKFKEMYTRMHLVKEAEWHDSYLFDAVRKIMDKDYGNLKYYNLAPTIRKVGNPWPDTPMAEYMDHLKGKARKDAGEMLK